MYQTIPLALYRFCTRCFRLWPCGWYLTIGPSLAQLVLPGCIRIEGSQASSLFRLLACIRRYRLQFLFSALAVVACVYVAGINPSAHHSRSLCSQAAFALRAHQLPACFTCLRYRLPFLFSALAVFACGHVAGILPSAHHSRSLCTQAAFALRAH